MSQTESRLKDEPLSEEQKTESGVASLQNEDQFEDIKSHKPRNEQDIEGYEEEVQMRGIKLTIVGLKDYSTFDKFRVACALMDGNQVIRDDNDKPCAFTTKPKVLLGENRATLNISTTDASIKRSRVASLHQEVFFFPNLLTGISARHNNLDIVLVFQIIEAEYNQSDPAINMTQNQMVDNEEGDMGNVKELDEDSEDEYEISSWFAMKINNDDGAITYGRFDKPLFFEPIVKPPFYEDKLPRTEATIDFIIEEFAYEFLREEQKTESNFTSAQDEVPNKATQSYENRLISRGINTIDPYIINTKKQFLDKPFVRGSGIDFYLDGARFLPDCTSITKATVTILTQNMEKIASQTALPLLSSSTYFPGFSLKMKIRAPFIDPTALVLISIETIDKMAQEVRTIGYSAINLFINRFTKQPPTNEADNDIVLLNGSYQLPMYCQHPQKKRPFNMKRIITLDKLHCASLLVRIYHAPISNEGFRASSRQDVTQKDWEKRGISKFAPPYESGAYNTSFYQVSDYERDMFAIKQKREDSPLSTTVAIVMNAQGINQEMSEKECLDWIDQMIVKKNSTWIIDLGYAARYRSELGFRFALDGFHNVPDKTIPYIGLYCLNPPAALYQTPIDPSQVYLNSQYNWKKSSANSPQFLEGFTAFRDIKFDKNLTLIIDVRTVTFGNDSKPTFKSIGWTILPIFSSNGYVQSGVFQLPIFEGAAPKDIIEQLSENEVNDPSYFIYQAVEASRLKLLEPMSAIVRLLDGQREGHFQKAFDYDRMDFRYLPRQTVEAYMYDADVDAKEQREEELRSIIPKNENPKDFNKKITSAFVKELGLTQYQLS